MKQKTHKIIRKASLVFAVLLVLTLSLFLSGCGGEKGPLNIYTGTEGVTIEFTKNNPANEVYEDSEIIVLAQVWNKGAFSPRQKRERTENFWNNELFLPDKHDYEPIFISLNYDQVYFSMTTNVMAVNQEDLLTGISDLQMLYLSGKSEVWPVGEKTIIPIANMRVNKIPGTRETPVTKMDISACYSYKTYFAQSICVDTDMYEIDKNPICKNLGTYSYSGQGAPVIVNKLEVDMVPVRYEAGTVNMSVPIIDDQGSIQGLASNQQVEGKNLVIRPYFKIYFKNMDNGIILAADGDENPCLEGPSNKGVAFKIRAALGNMPLTCAKPEIKMYSSEGSVRCWLNESEVYGQYELNRNYELPLKLEAEYFYKVTETKEIRINRIS
ncbi:MAG: hypothetical protein ACP5N3_05440 [Candidatus Nanoarchaeia archaeon]